MDVNENFRFQPAEGSIELTQEDDVLGNNLSNSLFSDGSLGYR